jgi:hypothetical protein
MRLSINTRDVIFLVASIAVVALYVLLAGGGFPLDDSWIHQTYARNLAETGQWAFVPGQPSAASTSPLYTVLLSIGYRLGISYTIWPHILGILALFAAGMFGSRMAERFLPNQPLVSLITGLALILSWQLIWAAASGMETMLFGTLTLSLIWLSWRELDPRDPAPQPTVLRGMLFGAMAALTTLARPEGVMLAGMIGFVMLIVCPQKSWRGVIIWGTGAAIGFLVVIAPYLLLNLRLTGGLLPNTAAAKQAQHVPLLEASYPQRLANLILVLLAGGQFLLVPGMIFFAVMIARFGRSAWIYSLPLIWAAGLVALYAARLPATYQHGRYVMPALPSLVFAGVIGTFGLLRLGKTSLVGRVMTRTLGISALIAVIYFAVGLGAAAYRTDVHIIEEEMVASAHWIADNIPPRELLAVHDIGAVGFFAPRPIIDLAGLVNPEVIPVLRDKDALYRLIQRQDARYLMGFPDQVPGADVNDSRLCPVYTTGGPTSISLGHPNMTIYRLTRNGTCVP